MSATQKRLARILAIGLLVTQGSCNIDRLLCSGDRVQRVFVWSNGERPHGSTVMWSGDQLQLIGTAGLDPSAEFCEQDEVMFTVAANPDKFAWTSSDSTVATVLPSGMLVAHAVGKAIIRATVSGITSDGSTIEVGPALKTIHFAADPPVGKVGQLTTVRVYAITFAGDTLSAPLIAPLTWTAAGVSSGTWTKGWVETTENSFVPTVSGETLVSTHAYRTGGPGFTATLQYAVKP
jgi:hypothetical protein